MAVVRPFFVDTPLQGDVVAVPKELRRRWEKVLRLPVGHEVILFNRDAVAVRGTWNGTHVNVLRQVTPPALPPLTLLIGLPKKEAMDRVLRQATELGVTVIQPVMCDYSVPDKLNIARAEKITIEAAEQCERLSLPVLCPPVTLQAFFESFSGRVAWMWERGDTCYVASCDALLVGPEGGFSAAEVAFLRGLDGITPFTLGQTILRTDTAVVAGLGIALGGC